MEFRMKSNSETADQFGLPYLTSLLSYPFVQSKVQKIPYAMAKHRRLLPIGEEDGYLIVAVADPLDLEAIEEVRYFTGQKTREVCAPLNALEEAIERCFHQQEQATTQLIAELSTNVRSQVEEGAEYDLLEQTSDAMAVRLLNSILTEAIQQGASDIHFEPQESGLSIRYRIDGVLQTRHAPPKDLTTQLIARIKVMAALDIAEQRLPQDGRIKLKLGVRHIDFRVSTIPVVFGERVVMRILDKGNVLLGLPKLGMPPLVLSGVEKLLQMSEGIILVTGPTGSGKTTTLYSALMELSSDEINIMTIEDPVEYKLPKMAQIGVQSKIGLNFATGLRHILRQDPDVIMIGEIRDRETAEIAIQASLTGHLVLSTLHTNDAPSAITRLIDMGIEPYLLSSSLIGVLAQRLVRTICPSCKKKYTPSDAERAELPVLGDGSFYRGEGCDACLGTGYKGRCGIYELMPMTTPIRRQIIQSPDAGAIRTATQGTGMTTLRTAGAELVYAGITTTAEVLRVTSAIEEI
ncbi:MAG: type II secretion system ATPase GspE [Verrucomicrobia bacterium]|nr:type II secretion system ATPase GspE [Verrucomicrobiota bacterium]